MCNAYCPACQPEFDCRSCRDAGQLSEHAYLYRDYAAAAVRRFRAMAEERI